MSSNSTYEGYAQIKYTLFENIRVHAKLVVLFLTAHSIIAYLYMLLKSKWFYQAEVALTWLKAKSINYVIPNWSMSFSHENGVIEKTTASAIANSDSITQLALSQPQSFIIYSICAGFVWLLYRPVIKFIKKPRKKIIRGPKFIGPVRYCMELLLKQIRKKDGFGIHMGSIPMATSSEEGHTLIVGKSGMGKSQMVLQMFRWFLKRNDKGIVHDPKREILEAYYNPKTDYIFNPMDERSLYWDIFSDVKHIYDVEALAASLLPDSNKNDDFWVPLARQVFAGILHFLYAENLKTNEDIYELATSSAEKIKEALEGIDEARSGYAHIELDKNGNASKTTEGILTTLRRYIHFLKYMMDPPKDGKTFSICDWIESGKGMIYLTNHSKIEDTLMPVFSLFVDFMSKSLLSLEDSRTRKIFFILDEFGAMKRMPAIVKLLKEGRSKGARIFLAVQDFAQIDETYSKNNRQTIVNNCGNAVYFAVKDAETAKTISDNIGEIEYKEIEQSHFAGRSKPSISNRTKKGLLVSPAEIMEQKKLHAIVKFQGYNFLKSEWEIDEIKSNTDDFIQKKGLSMEELYETHNKIKEAEKEIHEKKEMPHEAKNNVEESPKDEQKVQSNEKSKPPNGSTSMLSSKDKRSKLDSN